MSSFQSVQAKPIVSSNGKLVNYELNLNNIAAIGKTFSYSFAAWLMHYFSGVEVGPYREYFKEQCKLASDQYNQQLDSKRELNLKLLEAYLQVIESEKSWKSRMRVVKFSDAVPDSVLSTEFWQKLREDKRLSEILQLNSKKSQISLETNAEGKQVKVIKLFTTYDAIDHIDFLPYHDQVNDIIYRIERVYEQDIADYLFLTNQIKDFYAIPVHQRINQFPYESALIRKDIIPLTVREYSFSRINVDGRSVYENSVPSWWLPCYDLSTEFHLFEQDFITRYEKNQAILANKRVSTNLLESNQWFIKPVGGTRALGHRILTNDFNESSNQTELTNTLNGLHYAAVLAPVLTSEQLLTLLSIDQNELQKKKVTSEQVLSDILGCQFIEADGIDRVGQLLLEYPLLMKNRKFDMRYYVFVRSFHPFEAYTHELRYARLANKEYNPLALYDQEVVMSVTCHHEDDNIASKQERIVNSGMEAEIAKQYSDLYVYNAELAVYEEICVDYEGMNVATNKLLSELFESAGRSIGCWPNSTAYYAVDVIYDAREIYEMLQSQPKINLPERNTTTTIRKSVVPVPKLIEVSFMGDWHGVEEALAGDLVTYNIFGNDLLMAIATDADLSSNPRLIPL